eukprot:Skav235330  [mRNA]  locus=scaffold520:623109:624818:+ [translate_table: standard]
MFEVPPDKPKHAQAQKFVMVLGLMSSSILCFVGYPCAPSGWIGLSFRATTAGYFLCNLVPYFLGPCWFSHRVLRGAMVSHSIGSFIVSAFCCVGFGEWFLLMVMVHVFQFFGTMVLVERHVTRHLVFTLSGNMLTYLFRVEQVDNPSMDPRSWATCSVILVVAFAIGTWNSKHQSIEFLKQKFGAMSEILTLSNEEMEQMHQTPQTPKSAISMLSRSSRSRSKSASSGFETMLSRSSGSGSPSRGVGFASSAWIDGLEVLQRVGQGAFGEVYFCRWKGRNAAVKIMSWKQKKKTKVNRVREAELCLKLQHPNLVRTYTFFLREVDKAQEMWIIQEWCDLGTLNDYAASRPYGKPKGGAKIRQVLTEICKATAYLHATDVIHGDLTSKNVLLQSLGVSKDESEKVVEDADVRSFENFTCKVCDFGLARVLEEGITELLTSQLGTVSHMPPELLQIEERRLSKKADIWAIGMILYEMVVGEIPYEGMMVPAIILFVVNGQRLSLPDHVEDFFRHVFNWCGQADLNQRPSAQELVSYIAEHAEHDMPSPPGRGLPHLCGRRVVAEEICFTAG